MTRVGLISDTHGLLRPQAVAALEGCDFIVHGGDIGSPAILEALRGIAPLAVVRGNNDREAWADDIPQAQRLVFDGVTLHVLHDLAGLGIDPAAEGVRVVISGHSHKPRVDERGGVLYMNPGSAGPRRFSLPIAVGELRLDRGAVEARILELEV